MIGIMCLALVHVTRPQAPRDHPYLAYLLAAVLACLPDMDIAFSLVLTGTPTALHSGGTHSLFFAVAMGIAVWAIDRVRPGRQAWGLLSFSVVFSHVVIDLLTGPKIGPYGSFGVPFFWPFDDGRYTTPFTIFQGVQHGGLAVWFNARNMLTMFVEGVLFIPVALLLVWWAESRRLAK